MDRPESDGKVPGVDRRHQQGQPDQLLGADDLRAGRLVKLLPDHRAIDFVINASYPTRHHLSTKVRALLDLAAEHRVELAWDFGPPA